MKITIHLIGRYKTSIGTNHLNIDLISGDTIWDAIEYITHEYPEIKKDKKRMIISKNNQFTTINEKIIDGDEITLAPPIVSGG